MTPLAFFGTVLLALPPGGTATADVRAYEAAREQAGRDTQAQVKLALWCEAHGLQAERMKHLALAVLTDPKNVTARGLLGMVGYKGRWETPDKVGESRRNDEELVAKLAEYNRRRAELEEHTGPSPRRGHRAAREGAAQAHVRLGLWCEKVGLKAEAKAHFTSAVVIDPYHEATWKHLGYVKHSGHWMSPEQIAADRHEVEAQRRADRHWEPLLKKYRGWLRDKERRDETERLMTEVTDPRAVPSVARLFSDGNESDQRVAVQLLGQIDSPASSLKLAELAVLSDSGAVRSAAIETLTRREPRDYAGQLVEMIASPMKYRAEPVRGIGQPGGLLIETPRFLMMRTYDAPAVASLGGDRSGYIGYDANGLPVVAYGREVRRMATEKPEARARDIAAVEARGMELLAEAQLKAVVSQQRLLADAYAIETANAETAAVNARVIPVLTAALGAPASKLNDDENAWHEWWYDRIGYKYVRPPQVKLAVNASPQPAPPVIVSCFVAGTPVRTLDGHRPIESLAAGDQVLSQDVSNGGLSFQAVTVVHHNAPGATVDVKLDNGETLGASIYHRFWRAGKGWAMARELRAGDTLRTLGGLARIVSVSDGPAVPVFNLDVARNRTFFVGRHDALVHDNTLPDLRTKPFDAEPVLAAPTPRAEK